MEPLFEIKTEKENKNYAKMIISPLVAGYGHTLGIALRRVLLSSLPGVAVTAVKISGTKHQFSTLKGVREDVLDFLLNLKKARFTYSGEKAAKLTLSVKTAGEVKASDIKVPSDVTIVNPELVLANLSKGSKLEVQIEIEKGVGYSPADERQGEAELGVIPVDAMFSPVERVNYKVEETRVGRVTNYDKLVFEVWTDGTIKPLDATTEAAKILVSYFDQIVNPKAVKKEEVKVEEEGVGSVGKLSVEEINLPTRVANALSKAGFETVEKLVKADPNELLKVRNLGEKSLKIIKLALKEKGVEMENA